MTNPNNSVGTNAGFGGRTSPNAFNDVLSMFSFAGIVSGWKCVPNSGMTVSIGGDGVVRDVAIAEDNAGNRTTINNRIGVPIDITLPGAPATGNRYDVIVAYVNNPAQGTSTDVDYAPATGLIVVSGTAAAQPTYPQDSAIRDAITADGADGSTAYYVQLCSIFVGEGVTTIGSGAIEGGTDTETELVYDAAVDELRDEIVAERTARGRFARNIVDGSQSYTAQTATVSLFPSAVTPEVGCSYASGVFTITQPGWWSITTGVRGAASASTAIVRIQVNETSVALAAGTGYANSSNLYNYYGTPSWQGHLSAGDKVRVQCTVSDAITNSNSAVQQHIEGTCLIPD